jgi:hypothetical protein
VHGLPGGNQQAVKARLLTNNCFFTGKRSRSDEVVSFFSQNCENLFIISCPPPYVKSFFSHWYYLIIFYSPENCIFIAFAPDGYYLLPIHRRPVDVRSGIGRSILKIWNKTKFSEDKKMIDRLDTHPTPRNLRDVDQRSGKDRREMHTMLDPDRDKRKKNRRKMSHRSALKDSWRAGV